MAAHYQKSLSLLPALRELTCQFVFLTGTLPPQLVSLFERTMLVSGTHLIRSATVRRDLYYGVIACPPEQRLIEEFVASWI
jgi:hypothetical protein